MQDGGIMKHEDNLKTEEGLKTEDDLKETQR